MYLSFIKYFFDFLVTLLILVLLSPLIVIVCLLLLYYNKGKPFFYQERIGKGCAIFKVVKFKTMNDKKDENGKFLPDAQRITKFGKFIRASSIDELPQLFNVLKGDMSLIGPRPLLVKYLPLYSDFQNRRHEVRPGITGWAQVNGRNAISWKQKFEFDVWYVDNCNFVLDVKIFFLTILKIFKREGISANNAATMPPFTGNN
ncbi:MAG: sugar transferase [Chitinophagaceae bacterium]|jgi:lipopolysaccharide/colanic/teichoic acid biosynthesis glycosyltransferase|nr:sugar transferase [Chitinophagaceae bacterium]MCU0383129.1 sugar transferase [Cyclobacteriaceae bacterium]